MKFYAKHSGSHFYLTNTNQLAHEVRLLLLLQSMNSQRCDCSVREKYMILKSTFKIGDPRSLALPVPSF